MAKNFVAKNNSGHVLEDDHPTHYLPNVGRQVMAYGGVPDVDQIRQMMIGTAPAPSSPSPGAYTDPYGLKVAAPFVESMRGGYPTAPTPPRAAEPDAKPTETNPWLRKLRETLGGMGLSGRFGYAEGGEVEGDVQFLEDDKAAPLPIFARPETQAVTQALDAARAAQPREATMQAYEPTLREKVYGAVAGTSEARPTAERASFAKGIADILGYTPVFGQAMQAQEAARAGDNKGVAMAMLPMPAGRAGAAAEEAATNIARRAVNPLGMHSEAAEVARSLPQQKGTIEQMLAMMKQKVNPEELHWSGVDKAFQPGQKVTAEELASHFESKLPQVQETVYGSEHPNEYVEGRPLTDEFKAHRQVMFDNHLDDYAEDMYGKPYDQLSNAELETVHKIAHESAVDTAIEGGIFIHPPGEGYTKAPKYSTYITPGGENYREVVLHHPPSWTPEVAEKNGRYGFMGPDDKYRDYWSKADAEQSARSMARTAGDFTESHHDEPNVLGHIRMSDMQGPNGEKILNVHEFQSDWGQKARKHGVISGNEEADKAALKAKQDEMSIRITDEVKAIKREAAEKMKGGGFDDEQIKRMLDSQSPVSLAQLARGMEGANDYMRLIEENSRIYDDINKIGSRKPAAPYATSREGQHNTPGWTDLLIKRVMQEAEKGGYHKVVWDTPAEQGARYSNLPNIVKGMQGYYGDVLPRRFKKVVPEAKLGEHEVGMPNRPITRFDVDKWFEDVVDPKILQQYNEARKRMPDATPEGWLKAADLYDDFIVSHAYNLGHDYPGKGIFTQPLGDGKYIVYDENRVIGTFDSPEEAAAASKTLAKDKAEKALGLNPPKRPGFEMTPELIERVRKGFPAYRDGGEVDDALAVARGL